MRNAETDRHTKNSYLMMETEAGVMAFKSRNTKVCLQPLRASRGKKGCSLIGFRGILTLLITWFQTSSLQDWETKHSCGFKPHVLWYFVSAAPGNPYRASQGFLHERKTNDPCAGLAWVPLGPTGKPNPNPYGQKLKQVCENVWERKWHINSNLLP